MTTTIPKAIEYPLKITANNTELELYRGEMTFQGQSGFLFKGFGYLQFRLLPQPKTYLHIQSLDRMAHLNLMNESRGVVSIQGISTTVVITNVSLNAGTGLDKKDDLQGFLFGESSINRSQELDTSYFVLANMPEIHGRFIQRGSSNLRGRVNFKVNDFEILIDPVANLPEQIKHLKKTRSSAITHIGMIKKHSGQFSIKHLDELLSNIGLALTFSMSRAIQPMLSIGLNKNTIVYQEPITNVASDLFDSRTNWFDCFESNQIEEVFNLMMKKFHLEKESLAIIKLIRWYIESDRSEITLESRIVLITTALDYFTWNLLVLILKQKSKMKFKSTPLGVNITELLFQANIPSELDASFVSEIIKEIAIKIGSTNGPNLIAQIRNSIIHPNRNATMDKLGPKELFAVKSLGSLYLEFLILWYIGYSGKMSNRLKIPHYTGDYIQVPWIK